MKKYIFLSFIFIFIFAISIPFWYERPYLSTAFFTLQDLDRLPHLIAHKSYAPHLPPNSIAAIEYLLKSDIMGIEIDVQLSKDGVPIVFHDDFLEGHSTGQGAISFHNQEAISQFFYKDNDSITSHHIPTLEEVFKIIGQTKTIFLDIKDPTLTDSGMAAALAALIKKYHLYQNVIVESFNPVFLYRFRKQDPRLLIQFDYLEDATPTEEESPEQLASIPWFLTRSYFHRLVRNLVRPDILGVRFSVSKEQIQKLSAHGYPIIAWTLDNAEEAKQLFEAGVVGIQTNCPFEMLEKLPSIHSLSIQDASRLEKVKVSHIIEVTNEEDIANAIAMAKKENKKISIAGSQHTMGGHTFALDNVILKMHRFNKINYSFITERLTVQSGATWDQIQDYLNSFNRSVMVMQSDTIFSVGGSLSANVHGWQVGRPPIASTVYQFRLMLATGQVVTCSREENPTLFRACLGGYGLFGVILEVELYTCTNELLGKNSIYFPSKQYAKKYEQLVTQNPQVQLAYGRLSIADDQLLQEASLNIHYVLEKSVSEVKPLSQEKLVGFKRHIFRISEQSEGGKRLRWSVEKALSKIFDKKYETRNNVMHPDIHVLWPAHTDRRDILQEYFIPKERFNAFIKILKAQVQKHKMNLLNVTIREVQKDQDTLLAYARKDVFAFVLFFSQGIKKEDEKNMQVFTQDIINDVLKLGGNFYLPYRLHYTLDQFRQGYPMFRDFIELKKKYDPDEMFSSQFWDYMKQA